MSADTFDFLSDPVVRDFVFLGEAGCGKSELAVNLALSLSREGKKVSFFDLDMTKPLFRSRDISDVLEKEGVDVFYEEQFADAPTTGGWLEVEIAKNDRYCVLDVGGDYMGARAVGGYSRLLKRPEAQVFYVINPYRPWSDSIEHIDGVLSQVLTSARLSVADVKFLANPYLGSSTTRRSIEDGYHKLVSVIGEYTTISALMVPEEMMDDVDLPVPLVPVQKKIVYPW